MPVDQASTIQGYALMSKPGLLGKGKFQPWSYHPRILGDDDVEVAITHCGICASDIHTAFGGWGDVQYPIIVGHEIIGHVTAKGKNVTNLNIGDRVGCGAQCEACLNKGPVHCVNCASHNENHCHIGRLDTYNSVYPDGERGQGGYASAKRFGAAFAFKIPENISSPEAAPLLCAGATTYSPLKRYGCGKGSKVAVIGIGGLGHLAVQFAHKMGADVLAVGHSPGKAMLAKQLGAFDYISVSDPEAFSKHVALYDIVMVAGNGKNMDWDKYISLCKLDGYFVIVGLPEDIVKVRPFTLLKYRAHIVGSAIGSIPEIADMLQFCSKTGVRPMIEILPMSQVNEGIRKVEENDVKFRVVLEQGK